MQKHNGAIGVPARSMRFAAGQAAAVGHEAGERRPAVDLSAAIAFTGTVV